MKLICDTVKEADVIQISSYKIRSGENIYTQLSRPLLRAKVTKLEKLRSQRKSKLKAKSAFPYLQVTLF